MELNGSGTISDLVASAKADGVTFAIEDGELLLGIPTTKSAWRKKLTPHRADILLHLNGEPEPPGMDDLRPEAEREPLHEVSYTRITSRELAMGNYELEYLIKDAMVAGQPLIIAGPQKSLKTSFLIDAAVSLSIGGYFLGALKVSRPCRVAVMTGESGLATIQETARRVCIAAGVHLDECERLIWSPDVPKFGNESHLRALETFLQRDAIEVLFIDPAYLAMPSADAGNLMAQGELLRSMSELCQSQGVTMVLAHHTKKNTGADPFEPPELHHIAWAGFQEFARQWWLLGRRERYMPGTGDHRLWLSVGGSAGHSGLWAVDVAEGVRSDFEPRRWEVSLRSASEAFRESQEAEKQTREAKQQARRQQQIEQDQKAVIAAMVRIGRAETLSEISSMASLSKNRTKTALLLLTDSGNVQKGEPTKKGNGQIYDTFIATGITGTASGQQRDYPGEHTTGQTPL